jgi:hypothetical protein
MSISPTPAKQRDQEVDGGQQHRHHAGVLRGCTGPWGVAVDGAGNVYIAEYYNHAIKELPRAFVDTAAKTEWAGIGSDVLPSVLPASQNLLASVRPDQQPTVADYHRSGQRRGEF